MISWPAQKIARMTGGTLAHEAAPIWPCRIATDTRHLLAGDCFWAIRGKNFDGNAFAAAAMNAGAAAVVVDTGADDALLHHARTKHATVLVVPDSITSLNGLAAAYRQTLSCTVIAVGGSNGKTTTKRILDAVLSERFSGHASPRSFNNNIGVPLTLLATEAHHRYVVLEIGTNAPGEIAALGMVARPDIAIITSIGLEHLEKLGSLGEVATEEAAIAGFVHNNGALVYPRDGGGAGAVSAPDDHLIAAITRVLAGRALEQITAGPAGTGAALEIDEIVANETGFGFRAWGESFAIPLVGRHNVTNAALAMLVARYLGVTNHEIRRGLRRVQPAAMRMQMQRVGALTVLNDAYNANPSSMDAALDTFCGLALPAGCTGRRVVVLGDMLELGRQSEKLHAILGRSLASAAAEVFILCGPQMKHAANAAAVAGAPVTHFASMAEARAAAATLFRDGDFILLKGSRGMALETLLAPFSLPCAAATS